MKPITQTVLTAAVLVLVSNAVRGETMEERKQRIMRKYLRERQTVTQSDITVPDDEIDERIKQSEKFSPSQIDLSKDSVAAPRAMPMVRAVQEDSQSDWWIADEDLDADPYADPFSQDSIADDQQSRDEWWSEWRSRQDARNAQQQQSELTQSYGSQSSSDPYSRDQYRYGSSREQSRQSPYSYSGSDRSGYETRTEGQIGPYGQTTYGTSPSSGMLTMPEASFGQDSSSDSTTSGLNPYRSPYQTRQDQQQQTVTPRRQEEFQRTTPVQRWKDRTPAWDPTADDAYLNDLMRRDRR